MGDRRLSFNAGGPRHQQAAKAGQWVRLHLLVITLVPFALASCNDGKPPNGKLTTVVLAESSLAVPSSLTFIAREKGFWKKQGVDVKVSSFAAGRLAFDALLAGKADFATVAETPLVLGAFRKQDFVVICAIMTSEKEMKVISRKDAGISKPSDLRGRKLGVLLGTNAEFFMEKFLSANGLSRSDVTVVNLRPPDMVIALVSKDIDAGFGWQPHIWNAQTRLGAQAVLFPNDGLYEESFLMVTTPAYVEKNPKAVNAVIHGLVEAASFAEKSRHAAIAIVARQVNIPADGVAEFWDDFDFRIDLRKSVLEHMGTQGKWAMKAKIAPEGSSLPDFSKHVMAAPLKRLYPDKVSFD